MFRERAEPWGVLRGPGLQPLVGEKVRGGRSHRKVPWQQLRLKLGGLKGYFGGEGSPL